MFRAVSIAFLSLVLLVGTMTGCRSVSEQDPSGGGQLPWNLPAPWENSFIGVPY
jgi:hypothetical protein